MGLRKMVSNIWRLLVVLVLSAVLISDVRAQGLRLQPELGGDVEAAPVPHRLLTALAMSSLPACLKGISGAVVILPASPQYNAERKDYNLRTQAKPAALVYPATAAQVQSAVKCAWRFRTRVVPRCGGHSFEGYSVQNGVVVVDLSRINAVKVASKTSTAMIGGGATLSQVYTRLWTAGRYAFPGGTTGAVGFAGLTLGGGFGYLTRKYGLASDNVLAVQAVLADGSLVTANAKTRSDLLWACRGGGGGQFAIVTRFTVRVYKQPDGKASYAVLLRWNFSVALAVKAMNWYQTKAPTLPRNYSGDFTIHGDGSDGGSIKIGGVYLGSKDDALSMFTAAGLFRALGRPQSNQGYQQVLTSTLGFTYYQPPLYFKSHSVMQLKPYPKPALQAIAQRLAAGRKTLSKLDPEIEFEIQWHPLGGRVRDLAPRATAFPYRSALFNAKLRAAWHKPAHASACKAWLEGIADAVAPYNSKTAYSDYIDADLGSRANRLYFGVNLQRLRTVKRKYDPGNAFRFPNSIT